MKYPLVKPHFQPKPRTHELVSIALALLNTGLTATIGAGFATFAAGFQFFATQVILAGAAKLLAPKQRTPPDQGYTVNSLTTIGDHAIVYGEDKVGGVVIFDEVTNGKKYLNRVIALAGHECEAITEVWFNDDKLTLDEDGNVTAPEQYAGKAVVRTHLGSPNQQADAALVNSSNGKWTSEHRARGICYIYVRFEYDRKAYPRGVPTVTAKVKGRKVFDTRTNARVWSDNAALCVLDYLTSDFGLGVELSRVDAAAFSTAANICDERVTTAKAASVKRYTTNGSFTTAASIQPTLEALCGAMAGVPIYGPTTWSVKAGAYNLPSKSLGDSDLRSNLSMQTRHKRAENFNGISGTFKGEASEYKETDYPTVRSDVFETEDGGYLPNHVFNLGFTNTPEAAQRLAKAALYNHREQIRFSATFSMVAFDILVGDTIQFSYESYGWINKTFEVLSWRFVLADDLAPQIEMQMKETSAGIYRWNAEEQDFLLNNTNLPDPSISEVPGITYETELRVVNENAIGVLKITVYSEAIYTDRFEVGYKQSSSDVWISVGTGEDSLFEILEVVDGRYDIRARTITSVGIKSNWNELTNIPLEVFSLPPAKVTGFGYTLNSNMLVFNWDASPSLDLSHYVLSYATLGGNFESANVLVEKIPRPGTSVTVPAAEGIYFIVAVDKTNNRSVNQASVTVSRLDFEDWTLVKTVSEGPRFTGRKTNLSVINSRLQVRDINQEGVYTFSTNTDLGGIYNAYVLVGLENVNATDSQGIILVDDFPHIDSIEGLWDDYGATRTTGSTSFSGAESFGNITIQHRNADNKFFAFYPGELRTRRPAFRLILRGSQSQRKPFVSQASVRIYLRNRSESESGVQLAGSALRINFNAKFHTLKSVVAQIDNPASGDRILVTRKDRGGFTIVVRNAAGRAVARQISFVATGYGMEQAA